MKSLFSLLCLALLPLALHAQDDDMYFTPTKKKNVTPSSTAAGPVRRPVRTIIADDPVDIAVYNTRSRDDDEYNRRYVGTYQTSGGYDADTLAADTLYGGTAEYDDEDDYLYSRRILRFRSPRVGIAISSPYYWDLVYSYGAYDYIYSDPYYYDPFYWHYGWGYGWCWGPWSSWYGPMWGWHHPHAWTYWGWGPSWHHAHHGWAHAVPNRYQRGNMSYGIDRNTRRIRAGVLSDGGRTYAANRNGVLTRTSAASRGGLTRSAAVTRGDQTRPNYTDYTRSRSNSTYTRQRTAAQNGTSESTRAVRQSSTRATSTTTPQRTTSVPQRSTRAPYGGASRGGSYGGGSYGGSRGGSYGGGGGSRGGGRR